MSGAPSAVYVLPGKIGGVLNFVDNLLMFFTRPSGAQIEWYILFFLCFTVTIARIISVRGPAWSGRTRSSC